MKKGKKVQVAPKATTDAVTENSANVNVDITNVKTLDNGMKEVQTSMGIVLVDKDGNISVKRGRPADPTSDRFKRLQELEEKKAAGLYVGRGRPTNPNSDRQQKLAEHAEKMEALGLDPDAKLKQGRPMNPTSERQLKLQERAKRVAAIKAEIAAAGINLDSTSDVEDLSGEE